MTAQIPPASDFLDLPAAAIGIISDSHGRAARTRAAAEAVAAAGAEVIIHLGDLCDEDVIEALLGFRASNGCEIPVRILLGNMDLEAEAMRRHARRLGVFVDEPAGFYRVAGRRVVAHHGHQRGFERAAINAGADYYLHGHTHTLRDECVAGTRVINPGALFRASRHTAATLDCSSDRLRIFEVASA